MNDLNTLIEAIKKARFVFVCGNGGSASTAEHFTNDLFKKGIKAICLNSNVSIITMIANDLSYEQIFSEQLKVYASSQDLLVTVSCSGESLNITDAIMKAKIIGMSIYQFESFKDDSRDYGVLENKHLIFAHIVAKQLFKL